MIGSASRRGDNVGAPQSMSPLAIRVHAEYREMPGMRLTVRQAARLFSLAPDVADAVLHELRRASILACSNDGAFALIATVMNHMSPQVDTGSLRNASMDRLACLLRHWTWADEA